MIDLMIDYAGCLFLFLTGWFCTNYGSRLKRKLDWCKSRHVAYVVIALCYLIGTWHALFAIIKFAYITTWWLTT